MPAWNDNSDTANQFRKWFNRSAQHKWNQHKNRSLRRMFDRCKGNIEVASTHPPPQIDSETWSNLLSTYKKNSENDGSGSVKYNKNYKFIYCRYTLAF